MIIAPSSKNVNVKNVPLVPMLVCLKVKRSTGKKTVPEKAKRNSLQDSITHKRITDLCLVPYR